jgi:pimeloyl-ACP methyl ester carboxylesterase
MKKKYTLLLAIVLITTVPACITLRKTDRKILSNFKKEGLQAQVNTFIFEDKTLRYVLSKEFNKELSTVLFIHGAPGSNSDYEDYLTDKDLNQKANLISVDRLGYGYSDFGNAQTSIQKQAQSIQKLMDSLDTPNIILVGWSFGGPIAGQIAINRNQTVSHLIMLAPALSPEHERYFTIGKLAQHKLSRWLVPTPFVMAQEEKIEHVKELQKLEKLWPQLKTPTTYLHGSDDDLVPYDGNINFVKNTFEDSLLTVKTIDGSGHLFPMTDMEIVKKVILEKLNEK